MDRRTRALMLELRALIAAEVPRSIHARSVPTDPREANYGHGLGLPYSPPFKRYIGHSDGWGKSRLGTASILEVSEWCDRRHPSHRREGLRPLCAKLLFDVCYWGQDPDPRFDFLLGPALRHALAWREQQSRPRLDEPLANQPLQQPGARGKVVGDGHRRSADKGIGHDSRARGTRQIRRTA